MNTEKSALTLFNSYRECTRSVWNNYFLELFDSSQNWALVDSFEVIKAEFFQSLVLFPALGERATEYSFGVPSQLIKVGLRGDTNSNTSVMINRTKGATHGYWDYPLTMLDPTTQLLFVNFFDWNQYGFIDMNLVIAEIANCPKNPEIEGHRLIVDLLYVDFVIG